MRNEDVKRGNPGQMGLGVAVGSAVAVAVELLVLLLGAAAISGGVLQESAQLQLVALACVLGGLVGGLVCACRWPPGSCWEGWPPGESTFCSCGWSAWPGAEDRSWRCAAWWCWLAVCAAEPWRGYCA